MLAIKQIPVMKKTFGQNLSQIVGLYDFYGQKNLGCQSSGIELNKQTFPTRTRKTARVYIHFEAHKICILSTNLQLPTRKGFEVMNF